VEPANSKFLDERIKQGNSADANENEIILDKRRREEQIQDNSIKAAIEKQIKRLMTNTLLFTNSHQAFATNNNLMIPKHINSRLKTIAEKKSPFTDIIPRRKYLLEFICEKSYILTGDSQCSLVFISYQQSGYLLEK
jgi:hypothetical protein